MSLAPSNGVQTQIARKGKIAMNFILLLNFQKSSHRGVMSSHLLKVTSNDTFRFSGHVWPLNNYSHFIH